MSGSGCRLPQTAGRSGLPKIRQRLASSNCAQRTPAGLPLGMPGIGLEMEGAMQHAPQWGRQSMTGAVDEIAVKTAIVHQHIRGPVEAKSD